MRMRTIIFEWNCNVPSMGLWPFPFTGAHFSPDISIGVHKGSTLIVWFRRQTKQVNVNKLRHFSCFLCLCMLMHDVPFRTAANLMLLCFFCCYHVAFVRIVVTFADLFLSIPHFFPTWSPLHSCYEQIILKKRML